MVFKKMSKSVINSSQNAPFYTSFLKIFRGNIPTDPLASLRTFGARQPGSTTLYHFFFHFFKYFGNDFEAGGIQVVLTVTVFDVKYCYSNLISKIL